MEQTAFWTFSYRIPLHCRAQRRLNGFRNSRNQIQLKYARFLHCISRHSTINYRAQCEAGRGLHLLSTDPQSGNQLAEKSRQFAFGHKFHLQYPLNLPVVFEFLTSKVETIAADHQSEFPFAWSLRGSFLNAHEFLWLTSNRIQIAVIQQNHLCGAKERGG